MSDYWYSIQASGKQAYKNFLSPAHNPWPADVPEYDVWRLGWKQAAKADKNHVYGGKL